MIHGELTLQHINKDGHVLHSKTKHNQVTTLGKIGVLARGIAGLFDQCNQYGASVQKGLEAGDYNDYAKPANSAIKLLLTSLQASSLAGKSFEVISDSDILGYGFEDVVQSSNPKQGVRQNATDAQGNIIVANATRAAGKWTWSGIEGNLNSIVMQTPPFAVYHKIDDDTQLSMTRFIPEGFAGVPAGYIAVGNSTDGFTKLLNLATLQLSDFEPSSYNITDTEYGVRSGFKFGNYTITFIPVRDGYNDLTKNLVTVFNRQTQAAYTVALNSLVSGLWAAGFTVKNNNLYLIGGVYNSGSSPLSVYQVTLTDSAMSLSAVTASDIVDSSWWRFIHSNYYDFNKFSFVPVQNGTAGEYYTLCFPTNNGTTGVGTTTYIVKDLSIETASTATVMPYFAGRINTNSIGSDRLSNALSVYCNCVINVYTGNGYTSAFDYGFYVSPEGQFGNVFSCFDLEETWTIAAADTLQVTYTYTLEDAV